MQIKLDQIQPFPRPIRTTWDEDKMNKLAQSIKEQGLIVPIKVRPLTFDTYEIVYGHRRVEAMRRAGIEETDVIVEGVDDETALWQSIIENVCREDMTQIEEGEAYKRLKDDFKIPVSVIAQQVGKHKTWIFRCIALIDDPILETIKAHPGVPSPADIAEITRESLRNDPQTRRTVIEKAAREDLTKSQIEHVTKSIAAAGPKRREYLLKTPYSSFEHDPEFQRQRAKDFGDHDPMINPKTPASDKNWMESPEVIAVIGMIGEWTARVSEIEAAFAASKFSPEAKDYVFRRIDKLIESLSRLKEK